MDFDEGTISGLSLEKASLSNLQSLLSTWARNAFVSLSDIKTTTGFPLFVQKESGRSPPVGQTSNTFGLACHKKL